MTINQSERKVFIQTNDKQYLGALLSKFSILKSCSSLTDSDVVIMNVKEHHNLLKYENKKYLRNGKSVSWNYADLQSFTLTRFLPPQLMNFRGRALVIDPDVFALPGTNLGELLDCNMNHKAILACPHKDGGFKTSVMLLDCQKLRHWNWNLDIDKLFKKETDYGDWITLKREAQDNIGNLSDEWNHCDLLTLDTKMIHYTRRLTQPWKTGLPVDFRYYHNLAKWRLSLRNLIKGKGEQEVYQANPFNDQVELFKSLAKEALREKFICESDLTYQIDQKNIRPDFFEFIN